MKKAGFVILEIFLTLLILGCLLGIIVFGTLWTDRTLDFWCTYCSGHQVNVPLWISFIATIIGNGVTIALNIISEIVRLCL